MTTTPNTAMPPDKPAELTHVFSIELTISYLLRIGVATSLAIVVIGMCLTFIHHPDYFNSPAAIQRLRQTNDGHESDFPHTISTVIDSVLHDRGRGVVMLGLLLLIATPVARVAVSVVAFMFERDKLYVIITLTVLALLLLSFALGGEAKMKPPTSATTASASTQADGR